MQAGHVSALALSASLPVGRWRGDPLVTTKDVDGDCRAGKRTLVALRAWRRTRPVRVRRRERISRRGRQGDPRAGPFALLSWLALPLAPQSRAVLTKTDGPGLNGALAATARLHLAFGLLLAAGLAW